MLCHLNAQSVVLKKHPYATLGVDTYLTASTSSGDLDNDGKTDFIIQIPTPPNNEMGDSSGLFLSSMADSEELVKLVAYFISTGC